MRLARFKSGRTYVSAVIGVMSLGALSGCDTKSWIDPSEMGRYQHDSLKLPIVSTIDPGVEKANDEFATAVDPTADDLKDSVGDYAISQNDLLSVSIADLLGPGQETIKTTRVSESGNISLPYIGAVHAAGLTEIELEQAIIEAYRSANIIQNAQISVSVIEARGRAFSIFGAVNQPGEYAIVDSDFRVLNALILARDTTTTLVETMYVIRRTQPLRAATARPLPAPRPVPARPSTGPAPEELAPKGEVPTPRTPLAGADASEKVLHLAAEVPSTKPFAFSAPVIPGAPRIIRIPLQPLREGDLRYNIVIRPGDVVMVQPLSTGEYYMGGHVARPGVYTLTGRKITLRQAVISAGMLDPLAIPQRTDIIRRLKGDQEVYARVDLDKIFSGESPDIYLRPDDQVMVGTNALAPFIAAVRGAFRITYGFGFLYDRNFNTSNNNGN